MRIWPGRPYPLGATWDGEGVNFVLFSENATAVELCLFDDPNDAEEAHRIKIEDGPKAYETFRDKSDNCIKVVIKP